MIHSCHRIAASRNSKVSRSKRRMFTRLSHAFVRNELPKRGARGVPLFSAVFFLFSILPNRTHAFSTFFSIFSRFTMSSVFEEIMRQRIRAVSRNSARQRPWEVPGVVREDISGYGDFYVPILIHAKMTRRMARYFLRAIAFRASAEIYESCRPVLSLSLSS